MSNAFQAAFGQPNRGGFRFGSSKNWPIQFHRAGSARLIIAPDKGEGPRLKAWGHDIEKTVWNINGVDISLELRQRAKKNGKVENRYEVVLTAEQYTALTGTAVASNAHGKKKPASQTSITRTAAPVAAKQVADEAVEEIEFIDACVETVFTPDERSVHLDWNGDVSDFPSYMDAHSITITPPRTGGGHHYVSLHAPGIKYERVPFVRLNNVWGWCVPLHGKPGHHTINFDPEDMHEIRAFGEDMDLTDLELPNEPIPPRHQEGVYKLSIHLRRQGLGGIPIVKYRAWVADCKIIGRALIGMTSAQGQADFHNSKAENARSEADRFNQLIRSRYTRRPLAYRDYNLVQWTEEVGDHDPKISGWLYNYEQNMKAAEAAEDNADRYSEKVDALRNKYDAALSRCKEREEEYAEHIRVLYPA